ncbi:MAG TPA: hypothetical protein DIU15_02620, partial [Deltaproteobacteria bacterium]|nr:hypothetical protein [Deltaproteobacteria bacterium]
VRGATALGLAALAGYIYPMVFKHHAVLHMYRVPRLFVLLYATFVLVCVAAAAAWIQRDASTSESSRA